MGGEYLCSFSFHFFFPLNNFANLIDLIDWTISSIRNDVQSHFRPFALLEKAMQSARGVNTYAPHCTYLTWMNSSDGLEGVSKKQTKRGPRQNAGTRSVFCGGQLILSSCQAVCFISAVCNMSLFALAELLKTSS